MRGKSHQDKVKHDYAAIRRVLLFNWDPIGVHNIAGAQDEYDAYIYPVYRLLLSNATDEEVTEYLKGIEHDTMGLRGQVKHDHLYNVARLLRLAVTEN